MTNGILGSLLNNLGKVSEAMTKGAVDLTDREQYLDPIGAFLDIFSSIDIVKGITDAAGVLIGMLDPKTTQELSGVDIVAGITPSGVGAGGGVGGGGGIVRQPTDEYGRPIAGGGESTSTTKGITKTGSATYPDSELVTATMNQVGMFHSLSVLAMSIVSGIAEIGSLGQVDQVLQILQSAYSLTDIATQFYEAQKARVAISLVQPYVYWLNKEHQNALPPIADLARFRARETITDDEYSESLAFWGLSDYWADKYKRSRYVELDKSTIYQAFHRGMLTEDDRDRLLRIADYNPKQLDLLSRLSYDLPNRTELRLMVRRSSIPEDLVTRAMRAEGLAPEYMPYLIETLDNWELTSAQTRTRSEAIGQYSEGMIQEDMLRSILIELRHSEAETEAFVKEASLRRAGRRVADRVATIRRAFRAGLLQYVESYADDITAYFGDSLPEELTSVDVYKALMSSLGFDEVDIEIMLDDDRIRTKNEDTIEALDEFLSSIRS